MNFFELIYNSAAIGMSCYLGVMGMQALIELIGNICIRQDKFDDDDDFDDYCI